MNCKVIAIENQKGGTGKAAFIDVQKIDGLNGGVSLSLGICLIIISLICRYGAEATGDKKSGS